MSSCCWWVAHECYVPRWRRYGSLLMLRRQKKSPKNSLKNLRKILEKMTKKMAQKMASERVQKIIKKTSPCGAFFCQKNHEIFKKKWQKIFAKFCDVKKMLPVGRKKSLNQSPLVQRRVQISIKKALWSPFLAHLYDSPPSHNFFQTGFRPKFSSSEKFSWKGIPKSALFSLFFKNSHVS